MSQKYVLLSLHLRKAVRTTPRPIFSLRLLPFGLLSFARLSFGLLPFGLLPFGLLPFGLFHGASLVSQPKFTPLCVSKLYILRL